MPAIVLDGATLTPEKSRRSPGWATASSSPPRPARAMTMPAARSRRCSSAARPFTAPPPASAPFATGRSAMATASASSGTCSAATPSARAARSPPNSSAPAWSCARTSSAPAAQGTSPALLDGLVGALNANVTPLTRELGSLGTGDLPGLSEIALRPPRGGEGVARRRARRRARARARRSSSASATRSASSARTRSPPATPRSSASTRGRSTIAGSRWQRCRSRRSTPIPSCSTPGSRRAAAPAVRRRSPRGCASCSPAHPLIPKAPDRLVQDPYPFRVLPQVDGVAHDAINTLTRRTRTGAQRPHRERPDPRRPGAPDRQLPRRRAWGRARRPAGGVRAFGVADRRPRERDPRPADERAEPVPGARPRAGLGPHDARVHRPRRRRGRALAGDADGGPERLGIARRRVARQPRRDRRHSDRPASAVDGRARRHRARRRRPRAPRRGAACPRAPASATCSTTPRGCSRRAPRTARSGRTSRPPAACSEFRQRESA